MGRTLRGCGSAMEPDEMVRRLMRPAAEAMNLRARLVLEAAGQAAANLALEQAAEIADLFLVEVPVEASSLLKERLDRQNKVAAEIADRIRAEKRPA